MGLDHLSAHAALADQQPAVDQVLDGPAHGGPRQPELAGELDLVLQPGPRRDLAGRDGALVTVDSENVREPGSDSN